ncbi:glycosyltransferase [Actinoplanes sp. Pm04-4]|uniref:4,4'-diaponeurosporenoate glycosyltransferase n=1 Tax=Paractinoplanes pyxinae TaxID=2997416 RepID=A0ABT4AZ06_9ACTN|nr:glycosyltransferase [Actinoplanes pyxinae]MCY1139092.1 glycosyltransferase [Actinoplanes pyxinae]
MNRIAVVVPAHDEHDLLPRCLASLTDATSPVPVEIIVVADACTDDTAELAAAAGATVLTIDARNVGRARAAGMEHALRHGPDGLWLATTDADSRVAPEWLLWHLAHAGSGADLLAGTVMVDDWAAWPAALPGLYDSRYAASDAHVHGANLGVSAATYRAVGGFQPLDHDEDRDLIERVRATGRRVVADATCPVVTSARPDGRAPLGFSSYLGRLATDVLPVERDHLAA